MKKKAVVYARQSSGADDYSESVEVQIANCQKLAGREELEITGIFYDLNMSGKTYPTGWELLAESDGAFQRWLNAASCRRSCRPGLGKVMTLLDRIDYIVVDDITRLYRPLSCSFLESAVNEKLISANVQILQVKGGKLDLAQFDHQLVTMLKNQINDEQIAKQRQRSIEVLNKLRDSGLMPTGIKAFGLIYNKDTKRYTHDPEKIGIVKFIFAEVLAGTAYNHIVRQVNLRWRSLLNGNFWEKSLYEILRKPIYAGYQYNTAGELIKNNQGEGAVTLETFLAVQQLTASRRLARLDGRLPPAEKHWLPLSGLLYCGNCKSKLVCAIENKKVVYICRRGNLCNDDLCRASRVSMRCSKPYLAGLLDAVQAVLGKALLKRQKELQDKAAFITDNKERQLQVRDYEMQLQAISQEFIRGNLPANIFHSALMEINNNLRMARKRMQIGQGVKSYQEQQTELDELIEAYAANSIKESDFEELLKESVERIDVYHDRVVISSTDEKFEFFRRCVCRQKGFSAHMAGKLRRHFISILGKKMTKMR